MAELTGGSLQQLLDAGLRAGLYSGAAAAISTADGRELAFAGTHAFHDPKPVTRNSLFDLASVSKTFTAAALVRLVERGVLDPDEPVARLRAIGRGSGAERITLRMLLTHTSGLPAESFLWRDPSIPPLRRLERVLATELESDPDAIHRYSCVGYIAAGAVAEAATGLALPELLREQVLDPLDLRTVRYGPVDRASAVATEDESSLGRGMVRGEAHDELNWFLGGQVGNAGLFGTLEEVLAFAESFRDRTLLGERGHRWMTTDALGPRHGARYGQGFGLRLRDREWMAELDAYGHPGFTGTSWLAVPSIGVVGVLLTNRVHPQRDRVDLTAFRRRFSRSLVSAG